MSKRVLMILFLMVILNPLPLFAYLDPGSGSMLFSAVIGIVATLFFVIKGVFFKILDIPAYFAGVGKVKRGKHSIVFYSEGSQYWKVFMPVIRELDKRGVKLTYISSEENDPGLMCGYKNVETKFIGTGNKAFFYLNTLSADICVMTTPGLNVLQIKRSKGVRKYVHITHSAGGCSGYSAFGLDYYDVVLTGGEGDLEFIRTIEKVRNLPEKTIEIIGCTYLDFMREKVSDIENKSEKTDEKITVLLSPTWGSHGLLNKYGESILDKLVNSGRFKVVIRPHPQSYISEKKVIEDLMVRFPESLDTVWDKEADGLESMKKADIMISDFSGIVFDFVFLFQRPVLTFATQYDRRGKDSMDYPEIPWNLRSLENIGKALEEKDIENICSIIENIAGAGIEEDVLTELRNGMDKYPGMSGNIGADFIENTIVQKGGVSK